MLDRTYEITITVTIPSEVSIDDIAEWARYETGRKASLSLDNPLSHTDLRADTFKIRPADH